MESDHPESDPPTRTDRDDERHDPAEETPPVRPIRRHSSIA